MTKDLDTTLYEMRIRDKSASFTMSFDTSTAQFWVTDIGKRQIVVLHTGGAIIPRRLRILRRILKFFYGWLGYRPPYNESTVYRFSAVLSEISRHDNVMNVEMDEVRDLTVGVQ